MDIKKIRQALFMTQREFGETVGTSGSAVCAWELGLEKPRLKTLKKIVELCKANSIPEELWKLY